MTFQTLSTSIRSSRIWFHQSCWFKKREEILILQTVIKVASKNNLVEKSVFFHKNLSARSAICVFRPNIVYYRQYESIVTHGLTVHWNKCDYPWQICSCHNSGCSANREIPRLSWYSRKSIQGAGPCLKPHWFFTHSRALFLINCNLKCCKLNFSTHFILPNVRVAIFRKVSNVSVQ